MNNDTEREQLIRAINSLKNCAEGIRRIKEITLHIPHTLIDKIFHLFRHHKVFLAFCLGSAKDSFCCYWLFFRAFPQPPSASRFRRKSWKQNMKGRSWSRAKQTAHAEEGHGKFFWIEKEKRGARLMTSYNFWHTFFSRSLVDYVFPLRRKLRTRASNKWTKCFLETAPSWENNSFETHPSIKSHKRFYSIKDGIFIFLPKRSWIHWPVIKSLWRLIPSKLFRCH